MTNQQPPKRDRAFHDVLDLERLVGTGLHDLPTHVLDQWGASVRDVFSGLDAALTTPDAARAAFAGAYIAIGVFTDGGYVKGDSLTTAAHVLRWLYERGELDDDLPSFEAGE